jgi:chromate transporter
VDGFLPSFCVSARLGFAVPSRSPATCSAAISWKNAVGSRRSRTTEGLALAQLSPGPLAAQLAIYLGWVRGRIVGALLVSLAFVGPSFVMVLGLSALYLAYGGLPWMQGAFYGVAASVTAIIGRSSINLLKKTLKADRLLWAIALANAAATAWFQKEIIWLVVVGGFAVLLARRPRDRVTSALHVIPLPAVPSRPLAQRP